MRGTAHFEATRRGQNGPVGLTRLVHALHRFEQARASALRRSLRHPDGASLFVAALAGLVVGSAAASAIHAAPVERVAVGIGIAVWVTLCIYAAGAGIDAMSQLSGERADRIEREERERR